MSKTLVLQKNPLWAGSWPGAGLQTPGRGLPGGGPICGHLGPGPSGGAVAPGGVRQGLGQVDMLTLPMLPEKMKTQVIPQTSRSSGPSRPSCAGETSPTWSSPPTRAARASWWPGGFMEKAGWKKPAKRLWISSQTDKAIKEGFAHLRPASEYDNLFRSARARSEADWLVGPERDQGPDLQVQRPALRGRVQTPTPGPYRGPGAGDPPVRAQGLLHPGGQNSRPSLHLAGQEGPGQDL